MSICYFIQSEVKLGFEALSCTFLWKQSVTSLLWFFVCDLNGLSSLLLSVSTQLLEIGSVEKKKRFLLDNLNPSGYAHETGN